MMEVAATGRLVAIVRIAFVVAVGAAFVGDLWLSGWTYETPSLAVIGGLAMLSAFGVAAVLRPRWALVAALGAGASSIMITASFRDVDGRLTLFVDLVVLPAVTFVLLVRGDVSARPVTAFVALAGLMIAMRQTNLPNRIILLMAMAIGLAAAAIGAAHLRSIERERQSSVALARQAERLDLAREIHDVIGHHVTGMIVLAQGRRFSGGGETEFTHDEFDTTLLEIEAAGHETMRSVRRLVGTLRHEGSEAAATWGDVERFAERLRSSLPSVELHIVDGDDDSAPSVGLFVALRVLAEATTNVRRHGTPDGPISCSIRRSGRIVDIDVENGVEPGSRGEGFGLVGLHERTRAVGGELSSGVVAPGRWRLAARIPVG